MIFRKSKLYLASIIISLIITPSISLAMQSSQKGDSNNQDYTIFGEFIKFCTMLYKAMDAKAKVNYEGHISDLKAIEKFLIPQKAQN